MFSLLFFLQIVCTQFFEKVSVDCYETFKSDILFIFFILMTSSFLRYQRLSDFRGQACQLNSCWMITDIVKMLRDCRLKNVDVLNTVIFVCSKRRRRSPKTRKKIIWPLEWRTPPFYFQIMFSCLMEKFTVIYLSQFLTSNERPPRCSKRNRV